MSCHGCRVKYSFLTREHGCPSCGFSYCSNCLKYKSMSDGQATSSKKICKTCFLKQSNNCPDPVEIEPPALLIKRLENLGNPSKPPITMITHTSRFSNLRRGLSAEDQKLVDRLEKLVETPKNEPVSNEEDLKRRLANLTDKNPDQVGLTDNKNILMGDNRSTTQQCDDLILQYQDEAKIKQSQETSVDALEKQLRNLQGVNEEKRQMVYDEDDDETAVEKIITKTLEEVELDKKLKKNFPEVELSEEDEIEMYVENDETQLPWCIICNENAVIKCLDCDGDLYCLSCFKEGHDTFDMINHRTVPYKKSKN